MGNAATRRVNTQLDGPAIPRGAAPCAGRWDLFFPPNGQRGDCRTVEGRDARDARTAAAKALCSTCRWRTPCLEYALTVREPWGIWGGLDEVERGVQRPRTNVARARRREAAAERRAVAS